MTIENQTPEEFMNTHPQEKGESSYMDSDQPSPDQDYELPISLSTRPWRTLRSASTNEFRLAHFIDRMTSLLLDYGLRDAPEESELRQAAHALTHNALNALGEIYKGDLLRYLFVADLISSSDPLISLRDADLSYAQLDNINLINANLRYSNLVQAELIGARLHGADLTRADLTGANLRCVRFDLSRDDDRSGPAAGLLIEAKLDQAQLCDSWLANVNLTNASLKQADLTCANLAKGFLPQCNLDEAILKYANLSGANLLDCQLNKADLSFTDLSGANLSNSVMTAANLTESILVLTNLMNCDLADANLVTVKARNAFFQNSILIGTDLRGASLQGANFSGADLTDATLDGANLTGAFLTGANISRKQLETAIIDEMTLSSVIN